MAAMLDEDEATTVLVASDISFAGTSAHGDQADGSAAAADDAMVPDFPPLTAAEAGVGSQEYRRIRVPPHRLTPLRAEWNLIMKPVVEHLLLQIRYNPKMRAVELKASEHTQDQGAIQKGADFVQVIARTEQFTLFHSPHPTDTQTQAYTYICVYVYVYSHTF